MAEARKRAKKKTEDEALEAPRGTEGIPPGEASPPSRGIAGGEREAEAVAAEADLVFPEDPAPAPSGRIQLPASGTAEEILARAEAASLLASAASVAPDAVAQAVEDATALAEPQRAASISFFSAPAREERAAAEATEHLATFYLDREEYGVEVKLVQEIRRLTEITPVPRAPEFIRGVINLRGRIIPVVDLKKKLGLGEVTEGRAARIVVVKIHDRLIGMLVDGASQVLKVKVSSIEPAPAEVVEKGGDYIRGVAKLEQRLIILVDLHRILLLDGRASAAAPGSGERNV
jgi:purine-binding chemotaxis protein CheW